MALRVVFADDNFLVRQGTAALLGESPDVEVVAVVPDAAELMTAVAALAPDAVLTDIRMPPTFTDEGLRRRRRSAAPIRAPVSWCCRSSSSRWRSWTCSPRGSPGWATCSRTA